MKRLRETSNWNIACPYYVYEIGVAWPFSKKGCFASTPDTFFVAHLQKLGRGTKMGNGTEWQAHYDHFFLKIKVVIIVTYSQVPNRRRGPNKQGGWENFPTGKVGKIIL